jgi:hypothetical protein
MEAVAAREDFNVGDDLNIALFYIFILSLVLLVAAYFAGVSTDVQSFSAAFKSLLLTATGRNAQGNFAAYPGGAPTVVAQ